MTIVSLLGFTNGYLGSMSIVLTNEAVALDERGIVGSLTGFVLNAGLVAGASVALGLRGYLSSVVVIVKILYIWVSTLILLLQY